MSARFIPTADVAHYIARALQELAKRVKKDGVICSELERRCYRNNKTGRRTHRYRILLTIPIPKKKS